MANASYLRCIMQGEGEQEMLEGETRATDEALERVTRWSPEPALVRDRVARYSGREAAARLPGREEGRPHVAAG